jgi:malonyl CoA-acyl carrier protein transacylase
MSRLLNEYQAADEVITTAESILNQPLAQLLTEPRHPEHTSRENQIRLYLGSFALWKVAQEENIIPDGRRIIFGASAGETAAMTAAGFWDFESGLRIASQRGEEMHKASIINPGEMLVASGLPFEEAEQLAVEIPGLYAVNNNPGRQTVFSGSRVAIAVAGERLSEMRINLHWPEDILEAAHTWHMAPAVNGVKKVLRNTRMKRPHYDFMGNQAKMLKSIRAARSHFAAQLTRGVLLANSADEMYYRHNVRTFVDVGQGKVLYGQLKRQFRHMKDQDAVELISVVDELLPMGPDAKNPLQSG